MGYGNSTARQPKTANERMLALRTREHTLEPRQCEDPKRRIRLEKDAKLWLPHYMPGAFPLKMSKGHGEMIDGAVWAADSGTGVAVAAPRGEGKTTTLRGVCLYLVATGRARFPVMAGWTHKSATEGFRVWLRMLSMSKEFQADYPWLTMPFEVTTHSSRIKNLIWGDTEHDWDTKTIAGEGCGAEVRAVEKTIVLPSSIGAIAAGSIQGDVKGLNITLPNGEVIRPDLLLIDDAQDPNRADNPVAVADTIETIEKQWMCLGGAQSRVTTMVACTVAAQNDVSERLLAREDFKSVRIPRIVSFPDGWDDGSGTTRSLWDDWHNQLLEGLGNGDKGKAGREFYKNNKAVLTKDMKVSWDERLDVKRKDPDAMYSAMFDFYRIGEEAFMSEYQNDPQKSTSIFEITEQLVMSRTNGLRPNEVPDNSQLITSFADINRAGLHWCVVSFSHPLSGHIVNYGKYPERGDLWRENANEVERRKAIHDGLTGLAEQLANLPLKRNGSDVGIDIFLPDAGYESEAVYNWVRFARYPFQIYPSRGVAHHRYNPFHKTVVANSQKDGCHLADVNDNRIIFHDACRWREFTQKGFLGAVGAPGSVALYGTKGLIHRNFAEHICGEKLSDIAVGDKGKVYQWVNLPGRHHDYLDALVGCFIGAAWNGFTQSGEREVKIEIRRPARRGKR